MKGLIKIIKIPDYNTFIQYLFNNHVITWNPKEHEDWELPPSWCLKCYFELFPTEEKSEVVNFVSPESERRIIKYFDLNAV